jgi:uncharacterized RDD family membrane protein YckC
VSVPAPEKLTIDTPEQIALEFPLASAGSRFLAMAIDTLIQAGGFLIIGLLALGALWIRSTGFQALGTWIIALLIVLAFLLYYGYFAAFEAVWGGQTPGKRAVGIRVIGAAGQPIDTFDAILRNLLRIVDQMPGIYAVGVLSIFFTSRNQRLGDLAARTVVVHEHLVQRTHAPVAPLTPTFYGAGRLTVEEIEVIEAFLSRREQLPEHLRIQTARRLAARIRERLAIAPGTERNDEALINAVAAEYRR